MEDTLKQEVEALKADLKQIKADLKGLSKTLGQMTMSEASESIKNIKEAGAKAEEKIRKATGEARTTLEEQVREKPLGAVLIAFAVGVLLGKAGR
jgi:ElaB/YqjD/DUF883 family membrane-anchored ribosome-binding protein